MSGGCGVGVEVCVCVGWPGMMFGGWGVWSGMECGGVCGRGN